MTLSTSSPSLAKSAERIDGAMMYSLFPQTILFVCRVVCLNNCRRVVCLINCCSVLCITLKVASNKQKSKCWMEMMLCGGEGVALWLPSYVGISTRICAFDRSTSYLGVEDKNHAVMMIRLLLRPSLQKGAAATRAKTIPRPAAGCRFSSQHVLSGATRRSHRASSQTFASGGIVLGMTAATLIATSKNNDKQTNCSAADPSHTNKIARIATPINDITKVYAIGEVLGEGGFGQVYRATRRSNGRNVALKRIPKEWTGSGEFQREVKVLWTLNDAAGGHPHICQLHDVFEDSDNYWLSMELIEGGEVFEHLISHGAYSEIVAATFLRQFAEALAFMHSAGVVQ